MVTNILKSLFGSRNQRLLKKYNKLVNKINSIEPQMQKLSLEELAQKTVEFKDRFQKGETLDALLVEAFAVVREVSKRVLNMRHFDVQLIGGMVLHEGKIAEMSTGEGKTLMATLPIYLNALSGRPVYLVTVNDYLVRRDAAWMGQIYEALGLTVGIIIPKMNPEIKRECYKCDVIYATNNELGFDYLRNKMAFSPEECLQGDLYYAIIDEVDSILIDEARTPLIISGAAEDSSDLYLAMDKLVVNLKPQANKDNAGDFLIDEKTKQTHLSEEGHQRVEELLTQAGLLAENQSLYDSRNLILLHHLNAALRAHFVYKRDVDYLVKDNAVVIVDEHTGRTLSGRRWSDGLHQAVEAKEGVKINQENQTLASITFQNFFRLYDKLGGMTGTADTEAFEFHQIYGLEVVVIPTNKPCVREDFTDVIYLSQEEKWTAIIDDIKACLLRNQPVLVGTVSIETSEFLSKLLTQQGIEHQVLNAKFHEQEAKIVENAGRPGSVTIATNMAGRGTDIVLGGALDLELELKSEWEARNKIVLESGGLHIIGTERHESRRIDNQLRGRSGRQGDPGSSRFYLSLEDNLMRIFATDRMAGLMRRLGVQKGEAITHKLVSRAIENAQRKVEGHNFDMRKQLLEYDNVANDQRTVIYNQRDILMGLEDISENIKSIRRGVIQEIVTEFVPLHSVEEMWDISGLTAKIQEIFGVELPIQEWLDTDKQLNEEGLRTKIQSTLDKQYEEKSAELGLDMIRRFEKAVMLNSLDTHWKEHLAAMDHLRQSVGLRGYAQKDPKQEYKREAFELFTNMLSNIRRDVISSLAQVEVHAQQDIEEVEDQRRKVLNLPLNFEHDDSQVSSPQLSSEDNRVVKFETKVTRNEPCPCGSGKKYKQCHGVLV